MLLRKGGVTDCGRAGFIIGHTPFSIVGVRIDPSWCTIPYSQTPGKVDSPTTLPAHQIAVSRLCIEPSCQSIDAME